MVMDKRILMPPVDIISVCVCVCVGEESVGRAEAKDHANNQANIFDSHWDHLGLL